MSRPRTILAAFVVCLVVVLAAMAWVSVVVVSLDRRDAETQRQAELQENIRLALWRMDSALNPIVAQEQARPFHEYQALYMPPVTLDAAGRPLVGNRVLLPSPLLTHTPPFIKLHFQIDPAGLVASPQATPGAGWSRPWPPRTCACWSAIWIEPCCWRRPPSRKCRRTSRRVSPPSPTPQTPNRPQPSRSGRTRSSCLRT